MGESMIITLEEIKTQLRLEPDYTAEDGLLQALGAAAETRTSTYLNRTLYADSVPDSDPDGLVLPADVRQGILMLVTHLYESRSSVSDVEMSEMPQSFNWLVGPYRFIPL